MLGFFLGLSWMCALKLRINAPYVGYGCVSGDEKTQELVMPGMSLPVP